MLFVQLLLVISLIAVVHSYTDDALADQITNLPGTSKLTINFNQFSGYLSIPGKDSNVNKQMHYWLVESQNDPANDPITFWTNGGPGCSGLIGFMTEHGPFRPNKDLTLSTNDYSWNKVSNMVYIESPAGVGFSYSNNKNDYKTGDAQTATDNYNLIQAFLARFPDFRSNSLYISSESYGGHYMPTLAVKIVESNAKNSDDSKKLNFKGFAVGNPYTNVYSGTPAEIDTYWGHQIVPLPKYQTYIDNCRNNPKANVQKCMSLVEQLEDYIGSLNPYALDYPICTSSAQRTWFKNAQWKSQIIAEMTVEEKEQYEVSLSSDNSTNLKTSFKHPSLTMLQESKYSTSKYEPCADNWGHKYLNQKSVKTAIHVSTSITYEECSDIVNYSYGDSQDSMVPLYNQLIDGGYGLDILVYSGDDDAVCGTVGTQKWIWGLGYEVSSSPWSVYSYNSQTAGYLTRWKNTKLAFLTIHGAGHEVPTYKPDVALDMFTRYLKGEFTSN